jgi:TorA maturation chaperone TorD
VPDTVDREQAVHDRLHRAALFRAAASGFAYPEDGHLQRVREVFAGLPETENTASAQDLPGALALARQAWEHAADGPAGAEYARLFLGSAPCPPHETAYGDGRRFAGRATELADIGGFYSAFGLSLSESQPDLPDHIAAELEFYSLLLVKAAYADLQGMVEEREISENAGRLFLESHLGRWAGAFAARLIEEGGTQPYRAHARFFEELVSDECRRCGVTPVPFTNLQIGDPMQENELICPRADSPS